MGCFLCVHVLTCKAPQQLNAGLSHGLVITALHVQRLLPTDPAAQHVAVAFGGVEDVEAADLLVPQLLGVGQLLQLSLVLPHKLDAVALRAPEGLFELQEYLVGGADAQLLYGEHLVLWQRRGEHGFVVLLQHAQRSCHDHVVGHDPLLVLALHANGGNQWQRVLRLGAVVVGVVVVVLVGVDALGDHLLMLG